MKRSTERILTTHVGSLPRPDDLIRTMFAKQEGVPVDPVALEQRTRAAVAEVVAKQLEAGVDVVSDGEMSKPSYVTYITDRLDGFGGDEPAARPTPTSSTSRSCTRRCSATPAARAAARPPATRRSRSATPRRRAIDVEHLQGRARPGAGGVPERRLARA